MKSAEVARSEGLPSQKQKRTAGLNSKSAQLEGRFCSLRDITAGARGGGTGTCSRTTCAGKSCPRKSDAWMRGPLLQLRFSFQLTSRFRFCTVLSAMYFHVFSCIFSCAALFSESISDFFSSLLFSAARFSPDSLAERTPKEEKSFHDAYLFQNLGDEKL